ncbi:MAG: phenylalanine--tRNA ligase subunit alpha [candidate division Zixibacteria bacterium]|nr:phenylalanine--tRNA ligase subunit alpha [candidate division Zixibacteria bacterium]
MIDRIENMERRALEEIDQATDTAALEEVRIRYMGRSGQLTALLRGMGDMAPEDRPRTGQRVNLANRTVTDALATRQRALQDAAAVVERLDITLPGRRPSIGRKHPLTLIREEVVAIFGEMGFTVADGPEIERDYYNFEALNIPANHPARDTHDTFYMGGDRVLRTHTSPVQIRVMELYPPPVRVIAPGRTYRHENPDATHAFAFHQCEGLYVAQGVSMAHLKGDLTYFARRLFGKAVKVRFRPDFFPFTEPSVDYSFSCVVCNEKGCGICKGTGWLEISGAGMVDPAVFGFVGYDSEKYTGYAFGMGLDRLAMFKYGIESIHMFLENDLRFLSQG